MSQTASRPRPHAGLLVLLIALVAASLAGALALRGVLRATLQERADTLARSVARAVAFPLAVGDVEGLHAEAAAFQAEPDVQGIEIFDLRSGRHVRSGSVGGLTGPPDGRFWIAISTLTPALECQHDVRAADGAVAGKVRVVVSAQRTARRLRDLVLIQALPVVLVALASLWLAARSQGLRG
jgi:hypothetical protein